MSDYSRPPGKTTIAPDVLLSIARLTALSVPGVSRLSDTPGDFNHFLNPKLPGGVRITVENDTVYVDLYLIFQKDVNVRDVSHAVQKQVSRAITEMVGMEIGKVNVHVEDIDYDYVPQENN